MRPRACLLALPATVLLLAAALHASPVTCVPLPLPDGRTLSGLCEDDSWFSQPPWWYLVPPPPGSPPPLPDWLLIGPQPAPSPPWFFLTDPLPGVINPDFGAPLPPLVFEQDFRIAPETDVVHAPEPGGLALIGLGLLALGILGRWRSTRRPR